MNTAKQATGMTFMDTTDGLFMKLAYGWAFSRRW